MARPALIEKTSGKIQLEGFSLLPAPCSILSLNTKHTARGCYLYTNCRSENLATGRQKSPQLRRVELDEQFFSTFKNSFFPFAKSIINSPPHLPLQPLPDKPLNSSPGWEDSFSAGSPGGCAGRALAPRTGPGSGSSSGRRQQHGRALGRSIRRE